MAIGDLVDFNPHFHFEVKNETALLNPPFSSCSDIAGGVYLSAGYSGVSNDYYDGAYYDPTDNVVGNRYYSDGRCVDQHR